MISDEWLLSIIIVGPPALGWLHGKLLQLEERAFAEEAKAAAERRYPEPRGMAGPQR